MSRLRRTLAVTAALAGLVVTAGACSGNGNQPSGAPSAASFPDYPSTDDPVVWVTADSCEAGVDPNGCDDVNALIRADADKDAVLLAGDAQYQSGTLGEYDAQYDQLMAPGLLDITWPVPGNHDYETSGAEGYWEYWGDRAGPRGQGWYDLTLGAWRIVAANSNCSELGGCSRSRAQGQFIADALAGPETCELVFAHHPAFSDGEHGDTPGGRAIFSMTYAGRGDLVLAGHDHSYQRFAPQRPDGTPDPVRGVRSLVVGTGGASLYEWVTTPGRTEYRQNTELGALRLVLGTDGYRGQFVNTDGKTMDTFSGGCH